MSKIISEFIDKLSAKEDDLDEALSNFIFGYNISLSTIESKYFKDFIKKLRPAYSNNLPVYGKFFRKNNHKARETIKSDPEIINRWLEKFLQ